MNVMTRRGSLAAIFAGVVAALPRPAFAQFTEQEVRNGATITSTGDVELNQSASGDQTVYVDGVPIPNEDGVYDTGTSQVVVNDGRITTTGNVQFNQSASGTQTATVRTFPTSDGERARICEVGSVIANPDTGQLFYQRDDCCWYAACANKCEEGCCRG